MELPVLGSHILLENMRCPQAHGSGRMREVGIEPGQSFEVQSLEEKMFRVGLA